MTVRELAARTYDKHKDHFDSKNITISHLTVMYEVYYKSLQNEVFNIDKNKNIIYMNEFAKFIDTGAGWIALLRNWYRYLNTEGLKKAPDPIKRIEIFQMKVYPYVQSELKVITDRINNFKIYLDYDRMTYEQVMNFNDKVVGMRVLVSKTTKLLEKVAKKSEKQWNRFQDLRIKEQEQLNLTQNESEE